MFGLQDFRQMRVMGGDKRPPFELSEVVGHPECNHRNRQGAIFKYPKAEVQIARRIREVWLDEPELVPITGKDHHAADKRQAALDALEITGEEQTKRDQPVEYDIKCCDDAPITTNAIEIPGDLFGRITGPDNQKRCEGQIHIEHDKRKAQLAHVVLLS